MPSLIALLSPRHSPFAGPGESGRKLWRAVVEAGCAGFLVILTYQAVSGLGDGLSGDLQTLLGFTALGLVVVRRRFPVTATLGLAAVMGLVPATGLLTAVAAYTATRQIAVARRRTVLLLVGSALATVGCGAFTPYTDFGPYAFGLALGAVLAATTVLVPGLVGAAAGQQDRLLLALRERTAAAEEAERQAEGASRIHERSRIAAEMHDLLGHRLSLISLHAGGLEMALRQQAPELRDEAALVRGATQDAMRELREVLGVLGPLGRDTGTDALTDATGTHADIEALVTESRGGGVHVDLDWEGPDLDGREAPLRRAVHRVVRESLTNVHRYAAGARVAVRVTHDERRVTVTVRNGVPPTSAPAPERIGTGRGLTGLRERVALLGGTLDAGPTPAGGFAVTAELPSEPEAATEPGTAAEPAAATGTAPAGSVPDERAPQVPSPRALSGFQRQFADTATALLGLAGVGVMMLFGMVLVEQAQPGPDYENPDPPRVGMHRDEVVRVSALDSDEARAAALGREPARPKAATSCMYPFSTNEPEHRERGEMRLVRYCFTGDTLTAIDHFTVPLVTEPTDTPSPSPSPAPSSATSSPSTSPTPTEPQEQQQP
ncbi:sensor histidine kinase [Streptomyces boluensis]|uniref:histidine kinase n=1 Tax=Streptomyces boluensis TaxID=1775135 RepID=A0A964XNV4_9ACTN|nr:histidine kinase [Streptomyces boluensis]NBE56064.1 two-component sensor histidine kinase [Streptomyces boluensis]